MKNVFLLVFLILFGCSKQQETDTHREQIEVSHQLLLLGEQIHSIKLEKNISMIDIEKGFLPQFDTIRVKGGGGGYIVSKVASTQDRIYPPVNSKITTSAEVVGDSIIIITIKECILDESPLNENLILACEDIYLIEDQIGHRRSFGVFDTYRTNIPDPNYNMEEIFLREIKNYE